MRIPLIVKQASLAILAGLTTSLIASQAYALMIGGRGTAHEHGNSDATEGGDANGPTEIPPSGWRDILWRTYSEVGRDRVLAVAAGVTFYGLLAVFPAITAFVSLYGLVADPGTVAEQLSAAEGVLPGGAIEVVRDQIVRITTGNEAKLGFAFVIGLGLSAWSANAGVKAVFDALNVAYGEDEKRSFIRLNLTSLTFTLGILVFAVLAIGAVAAIPVILDHLYLGDLAEWVLWLGRWPALVVILMVGLAALYRFGPSRDDAKWAWVSPGAGFASVAWLLGSVLFSWYLASFEDYNKTYGALGAVIALLMWMWLSATIILVGAELNSEAERQTLRDTTKGPPRPIGLRGADAADNKSGSDDESGKSRSAER
ncbi:YihY/virulence factor BrkB family protein [Bosea sp. BH3]|uniref:YihY/virulence factor BrkB family protein n=1 Tax=Bosea sp. BH3 TaxID=2871701 RepID=UPI0021CB2AA5|nr:YihY/virulence factor BrkB family protein [Bosea sp. BH3]MCU4180146.1 YihY/virulence factor BrkB family protein [Bosea sp. BH3]